MKYLFWSYCRQRLRAVLKKGVPKIWAKSLRNNYEGFDFLVKMQVRMKEGTPVHVLFKEFAYVLTNLLFNQFNNYFPEPSHPSTGFILELD